MTNYDSSLVNFVAIVLPELANSLIVMILLRSGKIAGKLLFYDICQNCPHSAESAQWQCLWASTPMRNSTHDRRAFFPCAMSGHGKPFGLNVHLVACIRLGEWASLMYESDNGGWCHRPQINFESYQEMCR